MNNNNTNSNNIIIKYIDKIKELEEKIKIMDKEYTNEIEKKEKDIKRLVTTNTNLKNSLEVITQRLDKVLIDKNNKKFKKINQINNENNKDDLSYQLKIKEKEIKNQQQLIHILENDNKNIRNLLNKISDNENNIDLVEKVHQQYKDILNLQKNFREYKEKHSSSSQVNINSRKIQSLKAESSNKNKNKNKKFYLNSLSPPGHSFNTSKNKSNDKNKKKYEYHGLSSTFNYNKDNIKPEPIFTEEEKKTILKYFGNDEKYQNFIKKVDILEKSSIIKEKEMDMKIKLFDKYIKDKEKEIEEMKKESKEKDNAIIALNIQNKELKKTANELISKINILTKTINDMDQKNQLIMKRNQDIKNTIFSIDGIMEAKSKEGNVIPIIKEQNTNNDKNKIEETNHSKNGNNSSNQTNKEDKNKNSFNFTNSNSELGSDNL